MESTVVHVNKAATLKIVENQLELYAQAIIKKNKEIIDLKTQLDTCTKNRVELARALARKKGILVKKSTHIETKVKNGRED